MITAGLLVYGLFFIVIFMGKFLIDYLKERELCPCMAKVPFSLLALSVMIYNYYYTGALYDGIIWIPLMTTLLIGSFLIGNISDKFEALKNIGIGVMVMGFIYTISTIWYIYGLPNYLVIISFISAFGLYVFSSFYLLELKVKEVWYEYLYIFIMFGVLIFSLQEKIGQAAPIAMSLLLYSELINQISRFKDSDRITEYDSATLYLVAITVMAIPKFIF